MQVAKLTAPTAAAAASPAEETGSRAEQFARVLQNAFFGAGSKAVARNAEQGGPEPTPRSEMRSHELRGKEVRATERSEQRSSDYRDSATQNTTQSAVQKKPTQQASHTISSKAAGTSAPSDPAGQETEQAAEPQSKDAAAEAVASDTPSAEQGTAPAGETEDAAVADAQAVDADLLLILGLLQNQEQVATANPDQSAEAGQTGQPVHGVQPESAVAGETSFPAAPVAEAAAAAAAVPAAPVKAALPAETAVPAAAVPAAATAAPVLPAGAETPSVLAEAAAAAVMAKPTETSAAALMVQQQTVTPEEFAAIQQALVAQGQAKPAPDTQAPAATDGKTHEGKALVVEIQPAPSAAAPASRTLVDQSALLAMQGEAGAAQEAALPQPQIQPQPLAADAKFAAVLQAQAEPVAPQANAAAGLPNNPPHLSQQASPLANPGTPAPQAAQHAASHAAARQLGAYIPAGEQVAVQIKKGAAEGLDKISIRLDPGNLGKVDVRMEVGHDGRLMAVISADKPDTLAMLQRDAQSLEQSLRDAGLKTSSDSLSFTLRDQNQADGREGRDGQAGQGRNRGRGHDEYAGTGTTTDPAALAAANAQRAASARGGLDIRI